MKVLVVITSHDQLGNTGQKTDSGSKSSQPLTTFSRTPACEITLASPKGGRPRSIPRATRTQIPTDLTVRSRRTRLPKLQAGQDRSPRQRQARSLRHRLLPGSRRQQEDEHSIKLIKSFIAAGKPIGIVCHSTGALHQVKTADDKFLVQGEEVTGFTNGEAVLCRR